MKTERLGERSLILSEFIDSPSSAASKFRANLEGLEAAVPCYETVGLYFSENVLSLQKLQDALGGPQVRGESKTHSIPVCYHLGEDFLTSARELGLDPEELIRIHASKRYQCAAIGFVPGFAYLGDLEPEIARLPRLASPRLRVAAGSVAVAGKQTAIYPAETPGGWRLIGKTPYVVACERENYFPISAGDFVIFHSIGREEFQDLEGQRL
jgi:inhibitor of KinA